MKPCPEKVAINYDDYQAKYIGHMEDRRQFFWTTPFVPAIEGAGREFDALYIFDRDGNLLEAHIDDLGTRAELSGADEELRQLRDRKIAALGKVTFGRIEVKPFQVARFGVEFGLIPLAPDALLEEGEELDEEAGWWVELHPGDYMAFSEPFDSGEYDT